jgi:acyl phosphate:glycerol-3-phosphate acyltransferase
LALIWGAELALLPLVVMSLLLVWRHEGNIRKLLVGKESKLGQKAQGAQAPTGKSAKLARAAHAADVAAAKPGKPTKTTKQAAK